MNNIYNAESFKKDILAEHSDHYTIEEADASHIRLHTDYACGEIIFYPQDIVELLIRDTRENETVFYLHFQVNDHSHAMHLFQEMADTLKELRSRQKLKIILTCSSGFTTTYFASQLNKAAEQLKLDYEFTAVSFNNIYNVGFDYDVILLAPQVHFEYEKLKEIFRDQIVINMPAALFAQYSTGGVIEEIIARRSEQEAEKNRLTEQQIAIRSAFDNHYRILSIALVNHRGHYRFGYRIYDHGSPTLDKEVIKPTQSFQDIIDLLDYVLVRHKNIDAIALALPGVAYRGYLYHPLLGFNSEKNIGGFLTEKYDIPVILINDVNAMALGYFAIHENSENMVFYFQPRGMVQAGAGVIIDGKLHRGYRHVAGEIGDLITAVVPEAEQMIMSPEGAMEVVSRGLLAFMTTVAPEKIVIYSELTPDMDELRRKLSTMIDEDFIPELIRVDRLMSYMLPGAMIHGLEILEQNPENFSGGDPFTSEQSSFQKTLARHRK